MRAGQGVVGVDARGAGRGLSAGGRVPAAPESCARVGKCTDRLSRNVRCDRRGTGGIAPAIVGSIRSTRDRSVTSLRMKHLLLDSAYSDQFAYLAIKQGWITKFTECEYIGSEDVSLRLGWTREEHPRISKTALLRWLVLYGRLEVDAPDLDWSSLVDAGVVIQREPVDPDAASGESSSRDRLAMRSARATAIQIVRASRYALAHANWHCWARHSLSRCRPNPRALQPWEQIELESIVRQIDLNLEGARSNFDTNLTGTGVGDRVPVYINELAQIIRRSGESRLVFATALPWQSPVGVSNAAPLVNDLYYCVRARLGSQLLVLPTPTTIEEALRMRENKHLPRLRAVIGAWLEALGDGDLTIEKAIRKDITIANRALRRAEGWQTFSRSPISFWVRAIGGHIPLLSNVLSAVDLAGGLAENVVAMRHGWVREYARVGAAPFQPQRLR